MSDDPAKWCQTCGANRGEPHYAMDDDCTLPHRYDQRDHPPQADAGLCCRNCIERHKEWLDEIRDLYSQLGAVVPADSIPDDTAEHGHVKKQPASPALVRLDAWAMSEDRARLHAAGGTDGDYHIIEGYIGGLPDVPAVLTAWAQWSIEAGGPIRTTAVNTVSGAVVQLDGAAGHIARQPWLDDYDAELRWLRRALRRAHAITEPAPIGECLSLGCGGQVWRGETATECGRCNRAYGRLDLARLLVHERRNRPA